MDTYISCCILKIEKCEKRLSEARALVEEAERSLQLVMKTLQQ